MNLDRMGEVVTFFSYKGGTGRTMALANVAWILASQGKRVLVVDWDLEAPGLQRFYHPFIESDLLEGTDGIVDILMEYARAATQEADRPDDWHLEYARVMPKAVSLDWEFPDGGTLDIIPAGRPGRGYTNALAGFQWDNFYGRLGGSLLFSAMRDDMKRNYDWTLIDSRTGLSDIAGICTVRFPDTVVDCFTMSTQSIEGAAAVARSIDEQQDRDIRILPVPMRVEDGEQGKLENGRALARAEFTGFPRALAPEAQQRYWGEVEIPYRSYYAYEETLATFADEPHQANSLLNAYQRLTAAITDDQVRELATIPESTRRHYARVFERRRPVIASDVFISYVPEDRAWAEWIKQVLQQAGLNVILQGTGYSAGADLDTEVREGISVSSRTIVVLTKDYVRSGRAKAVWTTLAAGETGRLKRTLVPVRVSEDRLPPPFDGWSTVDFSRDERSAAEAVLRALDQPIPHDGVGPDPQSGIRFPGTPPPVWNVPTRNASFTGRAAMLEQLRDSLLSGMAVVMPQALHGLGGVGKTQLALEFAHRFRADYDLVWWIPAEQEEFIPSALAEIAPNINIRRGENTEEAAEAVREALRLGRPYKRWLLVFDNAEEPERLARHLPQGAGHVIITSRNPAWSTLAAPVEVDAFSRAESIEHLTSRVAGLDDEAAAHVAQLLGDLPLAVELATAWLETTGMPVDEYVALLDSELTQWLDETSPVDYPRSAAATWRLSIERLGQQWPAAKRLLELCSCFAPEPISMRLLYSEATIKHLLTVDPALQERMLLARIIREIGRYALAKVDQGRSSIQVHRLVQAVIRDGMSDTERGETEHEVHRILVGGRPTTGNTDDPDNWESYRDLWPHLGLSNANTCNEEPVRELLVERIRYLWLRGEYDEALTRARQLEEFWLENRGPDDRQLLYLQFHMANVFRSQGDFGAALELDRAVLTRQQARPNGREDVHTLMTSGALAADLGATGEYEESLRRARDTYERFCDLFGEDYPQTLSAATNLSDALRLSGDYFAARELDAETLRFRRVVLGEKHPLTLNSAANLARDMRDTGNFGESTNLLQSTLDQYQETLFAEHPETLRTASSLAVSLRKQGKHLEARQLSTATLEQYRVNYRDDYPDALACALNLACDLSALGDSEAALDLAEDTQAIYLRSRGPDHQYTLVCGNNRAIYLRSVGRLDEGLRQSQTILESLQRLLGPEHPFTLACAMNVANALADTGQLEEAEKLERATYLSFRTHLREDHPDTLFCAGNLAITLRARGRVEEAQSIMAQAQISLERILGADHPHIEWERRWRRISRDLEPTPV